MSGNKNLSKARNAKNDEFYTRLEDIQDELYRYEKHFKNKVIFCNCDDPYESNFWFYFHKRFKSLGLKKLISTHYNKGKKSFKLEYTGGNDDDIMDGIKTDLKGDGDFRSDECIEILKEADIVITNPPFSLFREYLGQLMKYKKSFLIIGNKNALTYKEIFPLVKEDKIWLGYNSPKDFYNSNGELSGKLSRLTRWFTNLDIDKRHNSLDLVFSYEDNPDKYPKYDNCDAINVDKVVNIPVDYEGIIGVPITFLDKYSSEQFEILGIANSARWIGDIECYTIINGKRIYNRVLIKNKNPKSKKEALGLE